MLDRRTVLAFLAAASLGRAASAHDMAGMASLPVTPKVTPFAPQRHAALDRLVEMIIPKSDTPGAREAGVTSFIELLHEHWMTGEEKQRCDAELEQVIAAFAKGGDPIKNLYSGGRFLAPTLRKLTIYGYYTSETGASEELDLNLAPGAYEACAAVGAADRAPSLYTWGISLDLTRPVSA